MNSLLAIACFLTELCTSQSITTSPVTSAFIVGAGYCDGSCLAGATAIPVAWNPLSPTSFFVFTAYTYSTEYSSDGSCIATSSSTSISPAFSVVRIGSTAASVQLPSAVSELAAELNLTSCDFGGVPIPPTDTTPATRSSLLTASLSSANTTSTESPIRSTGVPNLGNYTEAPTSTPFHHHLDEQARIGIGIAVPVVVIALLVLALSMWRRYRKAKRPNVMEADDVKPEDSQPYLQQKAELEAEEKTKYELSAQEQKFELSGQSTINEILGESSHGVPFLVRERQELRDVEHSRELAVP